ncbi:hypothetical protein VB005_06607 [Metarhizium brunneum]
MRSGSVLEEVTTATTQFAFCTSTEYGFGGRLGDILADEDLTRLAAVTYIM